jgi:glycosyltransferase involved in cell wall biosynthesis
LPDKIATSVVHHGRKDPRTEKGGVETFARNLQLVFDEVIFTTPGSADIAAAIRAGLPVICDNCMVLDWPDAYPVIGFQHGVAADKAKLTGSRTDKKLAKLQAQAASRPATLWVACARWISERFGELSGNRAKHIVYHQVDLRRFDGKRPNVDKRLVLHDARSAHKGQKQVAWLARQLKSWRFEPLNCRPNEVAERMRSAAAFIHLSRYEGNSIVCNEAMAMDLPCLFTRVGLMRDSDEFDVALVEPETAFGDKAQLLKVTETFLASVGKRGYHPRAWSELHASQEAQISAWRRVLADWQQLRAHGC